MAEKTALTRMTVHSSAGDQILTILRNLKIKTAEDRFCLN